VTSLWDRSGVAKNAEDCGPYSLIIASETGWLRCHGAKHNILVDCGAGCRTHAASRRRQAGYPGRLQIGEYEKDGKSRVSLGVVADHIVALRQQTPEKGQKPSRDAQTGADHRAMSTVSPPTNPAGPQSPEFNDDLPVW
jgi:hypothetical protein